MSRMVRKQILVDDDLERSLETVAALEGISQGELIRRALREALSRREAEQERQKAWDWLEGSMEARAAEVSVPGGRDWTREDLHDR
jgi:metal-responsive CopG/Arc/MetJ family transcriptional regulator